MIKFHFKSVIEKYWPLIKSLKTGLLLLTGLTGFMSCRCPILNMWVVLGISVSLFLSISGSIFLKMDLDRDIDARMPRICWRPDPSGKTTTV